MAHGHGAYVQTAEPSDSQWAATVAVRAEGLLLRDNVERAGEPGASGGHGATRDAGWLAGARDEPTHEQPQRGEQSAPKTSRYRHDPGIPESGTRRPGASPYPHAGMLHRQRDTRYERPCALCERLRTLWERGRVLAPPIALRWRGGAC